MGASEIHNLVTQLSDLPPSCMSNPTVYASVKQQWMGSSQIVHPGFTASPQKKRCGPQSPQRPQPGVHACCREGAACQILSINCSPSWNGWERGLCSGQPKCLIKAHLVVVAPWAMFFLTVESTLNKQGGFLVGRDWWPSSSPCLRATQYSTIKSVHVGFLSTQV